MACPSVACQKDGLAVTAVLRGKGGVSGWYQVCQAGRCECVLCVYVTVCLGYCHCCSSVFLSAGWCPPTPLHASYSLVCAPGLRCPSSPVCPSFLAPDCYPSPLAESSLLSCGSQIAEACCAFKESRLLAVTHFWLSARKIAPARLTEKKTNNFSFVCGVTFH